MSESGTTGRLDLESKRPRLRIALRTQGIGYAQSLLEDRRSISRQFQSARAPNLAKAS